jgi:hypothetical protein
MRCKDIFDDRKILNTHLNQTPACEVANMQSRLARDGFDDEKRDQLRSRKGLKDLDEKERWDHVFHILFPDVQTIPSSGKLLMKWHPDD